MRAALFAAALLAAMTGPVGAVGTAATSPAPMDYAIRLDLNPARHRLAADVRVTHLPCTDGRLRLHLNRALQLRSARVDGRDVQPAEDPPDAPRFWVSAARALDLPCPRQTLRLRYDGEAPLTTDGRNQVGPELVELSLYGAWYPIVAIGQRITWTVETVLPANVKLVSNAARQAAQPTAHGVRHRLAQSQPGSDIALVASPLFTVERFRSGAAQVRLYVSRDRSTSQRERARALGRQAAETLAAYAAQLGAPASGALRAGLVFTRRGGPLSYARLPMVVTPDTALAADDAGATRSQTLNVNHELAHFWSRAAPGGADDWINEGTAEALALRRLRDNGATGEAAGVLAAYRAAVVRAGEGSSIAEGLDDGRVVLNRYQKPALLFDRWAAQYGDAAVGRVLRDAAAAPAAGTPRTTAELRTIVARHLGTAAAQALDRCLNARGWPVDCGGLPPGGSTQLLSPEQQQRDFDEAARLLAEVDVDPFLHLTAAELDATLRTLRSRLDRPRTAVAFWAEAVAPLFAVLSNAHDAARYLRGYEEFAEQGGTLFPLSLRCLQGRAFVWDDHRPGPGIAPGSELLAIDGRPMAEVLGAMVGWSGGENAAIRLSSICTLFRPYWFNLAPPAVAWTLTLRPSADAPQQTLRVGGIDQAQLRASLAELAASPRQAPFTLRFVEPGPIAVMKIDTLGQEVALRAFVESAFAAVRERGARGVIVDLRRNGGGNSRLNLLWLAKLTRQPFTQYGPTVTRTSRAVKQALGRERYIAVYGEAAWAHPDGALLRDDSRVDDLFTPPPDEPDRFDGPWALLVGPDTYSSASAAAAAVKAFGLAPIIGEETGGTWPAGGEPLTVRLPVSGIDLQIAAKLFHAPAGLPPGRGVLPDLERTTSADDLAAGRDPVLDAAQTLLLQRQATAPDGGPRR